MGVVTSGAPRRRSRRGNLCGSLRCGPKPAESVQNSQARAHVSLSDARVSGVSRVRVQSGLSMQGFTASFTMAFSGWRPLGRSVMAMRFMNGLTSIVSAANNPQLLKTQVESLPLHISMTTAAASFEVDVLSAEPLSSIRLSCWTPFVIGVSAFSKSRRVEHQLRSLGFQHLDLEVTVPRVGIFREAIVELFEMAARR